MDYNERRTMDRRIQGERMPGATQCRGAMSGIKSEGMGGFFANTRPGAKARCGRAGFELPILYLRDYLFGLHFSADAKRVREIMPSRKMSPVALPGGRAIVAIVAFNYIDTTLGPYGELAVAIPALYDRRPLVAFSVRNGSLIRTVIRQRGVRRLSLDTCGSFVRFGEHPVAGTITASGIAERPFMPSYYTERAAILPKGEIVEEGVRSLDGYKGKERRGRHTVEYTRYGF